VAIKRFILFILIILCTSNVVAGKVTYNFPICGKSMLPLNQNSECNIYKVNTVTIDDELYINDIVCFSYDKRIFNPNTWYVCHRITDVKNNYYLTKGDTNKLPDGWINKKYIALRVVL